MNDDLERGTVDRAKRGDAEAGVYAIQLCAEALTMGRLSPLLSTYLADCLHGVLRAIDSSESIRRAKKGSRGASSSARSARDGAIAEALHLTRPASRPRQPFPEWEEPLAAIAAILAIRGARAADIEAAMSDARKVIERKPLTKNEAHRIRMSYKPMRDIDEETLWQVCFYAGGGHKSTRRFGERTALSLRELTDKVK